MRINGGASKLIDFAVTPLQLLYLGEYKHPRSIMRLCSHRRAQSSPKFLNPKLNDIFLPVHAVGWVSI